MVAVHIDGVESIEIKNSVACVSAISGGDALTWKMPLAQFRHALLLANSVLAEHDNPAPQVARVQRIRLNK